MNKYLLSFCLIVASVLFIITQSSAATFTVNSTVDETDIIPGDGICVSASKKCTLRAAVMEANALAGADSIMLLTKTYALSLVGTGEDAAATGDLDITEELEVMGTGLSATIIDADGIDRIFHVFAGATNTQISNMTITGGVSTENGAGLANAADGLVLTDIKVAGNSASNVTMNIGGGGVYSSSGRINIYDCFITENTVYSEMVAFGGGVSITGGTFQIV
jgi:CSLREA domain-containing protein